MKIKILLMVLWISFLSCHSQPQKEITQKTDTMERFNIQRFQENKIGTEYNFRLEDGTEVRQIESGEDYVEYKIKQNKYMETYTWFYKSGIEWGSGLNFYGQPIGMWHEYDSTGKLIKETDYEKPYKKSVYDIAKIMLDSFHVDIINPKDPNDIFVSRSTSPEPHYQIRYKISDTLQGNVRINIGKTTTITSKKETLRELEEQRRQRQNNANEDGSFVPGKHQKPKTGWAAIFSGDE